MMTDCCVTLFGVYLSGYHVIPLLLLRFGFGSGSNCHGGCCHVRAVHVLDCLVRLFSAQQPGIGFALMFVPGNSVFVTLKFETFVMSAKCFTLDGHGSGTLPPPCSCSITPSFRSGLGEVTSLVLC